LGQRGYFAISNLAEAITQAYLRKIRMVRLLKAPSSHDITTKCEIKRVVKVVYWRQSKQNGYMCSGSKAGDKNNYIIKELIEPLVDHTVCRKNTPICTVYWKKTNIPLVKFIFKFRAPIDCSPVPSPKDLQSES